MVGDAVLNSQIKGFFLALAAFIFGVPISFWVYFQFYKATRDHGAARYMLWFVLFFLQLVATVFFVIGLDSYGCAGFWLMIGSFNKNLVFGILVAISTFMWIGIAIYNIFVFFTARKEYNNAGGNKQAAKEMGSAAVKTAYDNRKVVAEVVKENKDTIKQVAIENKDTLIQFAKDNKDTIKQVAIENKDTIARVAIENKDTVWENRELVSSVFEDSKGSHV